MQLTKILTANQAKRMTVATRHGDVITFYGEKGDTYRLSPICDLDTGELRYACTCPNYIYKRAALGEQCKHGDAYIATRG